MTTAQMEEYVKQKWKAESLRIVPVVDGDGFISLDYSEFVNSWSAAYAFTLAREEEIRQVEEEIEWLRGFSAFAEHSIYGPVRERILAREQAALDALKKGWEMTKQSTAPELLPCRTSKFTAGPWEVNTLAGRPNREVFASDQGICDCGIYGGEADEIEANTALIAAAPEMYEALKEAKEFIENQQLPDSEWSRALDVCVAALAKAEGRQP